MNTTTIPLSLIYPRDEGRALQKDRVGPLADSIAAIGLKTPITVRLCQRTKDGALTDAYEIVCGKHRYYAALRLQWTEIDCFVTDDDELHAELWEIDENLMRAELSPAEEAAHLKRRKEIWAALRPESGTNCSALSGRGNKNFASETSEKAGRTKQDINRSIRRAEKLGDDIERVKGTSLDKGVELDALVKLSPKQREKLIDKAEAGEKVSAREVVEKKAKKKAEPITYEADEEWTAEDEQTLEALQVAWDNATETARQAFLNYPSSRYGMR